ncbi:MAG: RNase H family protein [Cyclobacteriaceae bacterium]
MIEAKQDLINKLLLFTDGSVDPQLKIGYGAYLAVKENELSTDSAGARVKVKKFEDTSSARLELQTLIWALADLKAAGSKVVIYTDSQNIIELPQRRYRLEQNDYRSAKNKLLNNHELYREFYERMDQLEYELIKVKGHLPLGQKDDIDRLFMHVDRASRKALKEGNKHG